MLESLKAQSRAVGFLERFARHPNALSVPDGFTPEVGENVYIWWGAGSANPTIVNEALEAASGTLIYVGANVPSPGNRFTITVMAELRVNSGYTSGVTAPDLTIGINSTPWSAVGGLPAFLATPKPLHAQIRSTGQVNGNFYQEAGVTPDDPNEAFRGMGAGFKFPITIDVDGPNQVCRITVAGRTQVYRDARYARCVNEASTGFFVEWDAPTSSYQYYWAVHSIAVNAPELQDSRSFEGGEYGRAIHDLATRHLATIPSSARFLSGLSGFNADQGPTVGNESAFAGNPMLGYAPYFRPAPYVISRVAGVTERSTAKLESILNASDTLIHVIQSLSQLTGFTGNQLPAGAFVKTVFVGRFQPNARLKIMNNAGGPTRFDSGVLAGAGQFVLTHYQFRQSAGIRYNTIMEWSIAGSTTPYRIQTYNEAAAVGVGDQLRATGTAVGDVTIDHHFTEMFANV